jgi:hypothetical protein
MGIDETLYHQSNSSSKGKSAPPPFASAWLRPASAATSRLPIGWGVSSTR